MFKPQHLLTLRAVCRSASFALAARELGYTSSAVSQQIAALEKESGLVLFEREAHGIRATTAAHRLVELSAPVLAGLAELDELAGDLATGTTARLRLGSFPTAGVRIVPHALSALAGRYPRARILLEEGEPAELLGPLTDGRLDVALVYEYGLSPGRWPDGLTAHRLLQEDLLLLRPRGGGLGPDLPALADARWITSREDSAGALSLTRLCAAAGFTPQVAYRSNNYDVVRELVSAGFGAAIVPALGHVADERILARRLSMPSAHRDVVALHRDTNSNPLLAALLTALRQAVPGDSDFVHPIS